MANPNPNPNPSPKPNPNPPNSGGLDLTKTTGGKETAKTTTKGGLDFTKVENPNPATKFAEYADTRFKSFIDPTEYVDYIPNGAVMDNEALDRARAKNQGYTAQFVGAVGQSLVGEILGGTIEGFGSLGDYLYTKVTGEETDFNNSLISLGQGIKEFTKEALPIYMENPDKSFQLGKWDYWMTMAPSIASSISMLIPSTAVVKGLSAVGKFSRIAKMTDKIGDAYKYAASITAGSLVSRNAENYISSHEVYNTTYKEASKALEFMPDEEYNKLLDSEVGKEFQKEVPNGSKAAFASYIASKAGWRNYNNNMTNLVFDAIQYASWYRALGATTRSASYLDDAVKASMGVPKTFLNKAGAKTLNFLSPIGGQLTEGIEEGINYIGQKEAERYGKFLYGGNDKTDTSTFFSRLDDYMSDDKMQESMFFGVLGGVAFETAANLANKKYDNEMIGNKLAEANSRKAYIENFNKSLNQLDSDFKANKIDEGFYTHNVEALKKDLSYELGYSAAKVGNINLLLENINSPEFREEIAKSMGIEVESTALEENIAGLKQDILKAEKNYKNATKFLALNSKVNDKAKFLFLQNYLNISKQVSIQEEALQNLDTRISEMSNVVLNPNDTESYEISQDLIKQQAYRLAAHFLKTMDKKELASHLINEIDQTAVKYESEAETYKNKLKDKNTNIKGLDGIIELLAEKLVREAAFKGDKKELSNLMDRKKLQEVGEKIDKIEEDTKSKIETDKRTVYKEMVEKKGVTREEIIKATENESEELKKEIMDLYDKKVQAEKETEKATEAAVEVTKEETFKPTENFNPEKFKLNNFKMKPEEFTFNINKIKGEEDLDNKLTRIAKLIKTAERTKDYMLVEYLKNLRHFLNNGGVFGKGVAKTESKAEETNDNTQVVESVAKTIVENSAKNSNTTETPTTDSTEQPTISLTADKVETTNENPNNKEIKDIQVADKPSRYAGHWITEAETKELLKLITKEDNKKEMKFYLNRWKDMDSESIVVAMRKFAKALNRAKFPKAADLLLKLAEEIENESNKTYNVTVTQPISDEPISNQTVEIVKVVNTNEKPETIDETKSKEDSENTNSKIVGLDNIINEEEKVNLPETTTPSNNEKNNNTESNDTLKDLSEPVKILNPDDLNFVPTEYDFYLANSTSSDLNLEKEIEKTTETENTKTDKNDNKDTSTDTETPKENKDSILPEIIKDIEAEPTFKVIVTDDKNLDYLNEEKPNVKIVEFKNVEVIQLTEEDKKELETPLTEISTLNTTKEEQPQIIENSTNEIKQTEETLLDSKSDLLPKAEEITSENIEDLKSNVVEEFNTTTLIHNSTKDTDGEPIIEPLAADKESEGEDAEIVIDSVESILEAITSKNEVKPEDLNEEAKPEPKTYSTKEDKDIPKLTNAEKLNLLDDLFDADNVIGEAHDDTKLFSDPIIDNAVVSSSTTINSDNKILVGTNIFVDTLMPTDANFYYSNDNLVATDAAAKALAVLNQLDSDEDKFVHIEIDTKSPYYNANQGHTHIPLGIYYKGVRIGYINVASSIEKEIKAWETSNKPQKEKEIVIAMLTKNLLAVREIRNRFRTSEGFLIKDIRLVTKIIRLTDGQIVQNVNEKGEVLYKELKDNLVGEQGKDYEFAIVTPEDSALGRQNTLTVLNGTNSKHRSNSFLGSINNNDAVYSDGGMYVLVNGFRSKAKNAFEMVTKEDGTLDTSSLNQKIPVRVFSSTISEQDVINLYSAIMEAVEILNDPKLDFNKNQRLNRIRQKIASITAYNSFNENKDGTVNKPNFKIHKDRIEFLFDNDTKLASIYVNDGKTSIIIHNIKKGKLKNKFDSAEDYKDVIGEPINLYENKASVMKWKDPSRFDRVLLKALRTKRYNINFRKLLNGEENFKRDYVDTGKIISDLGAVRNIDGKPISNFIAKKVSRNGNRVTPARQSSTSNTNTNNLEITLSNNLVLSSLIQPTPKPYPTKDDTSTITNGFETNIEEMAPSVIVAVVEELNEETKKVEKVTKVIKNDKKDTKTTSEKTTKKDSKSKNNDTKKSTVKEVTKKEKEVKKEEVKKESKPRKSKSAKETTPSSNIEETITTTETTTQLTEATPPITGTEDSTMMSNQKNEINEVLEQETALDKTSLKDTLTSLKVGSETNNSISNVKSEEDLSNDEQTNSTLTEITKLETDEDIDISKTLSKFKGLGLKQNKLSPLNKKNNSENKPNNNNNDTTRTMAISTKTGVKQPSSSAEKEANFERMFGKNVEFDSNVDNLIFHKGSWAYGLFAKSSVRIYKNAPAGTEYHEAFHVVMHLYLNEENRNEVLNEIAKLYPNVKDLVELEEILAEDFRAYALLKDKGLSTKLFDKKYKNSNAVKNFFIGLYNFIANLLGINTYKATNISELFNNIYSGNFNYKPDQKTVEYAKKVGYMMESEEIDMTLENYFTPKEIQTYVSSLGLFIMEYMREYQDKTNREIYTSKDKMTVKKYVLQQLVDRLEVAYEAYEKASENENITEEEITPIREKAESLHTIITLFGDRQKGFWKEALYYVEKNLNMKVNKNLESAIETIEMGEVFDEGLTKDWDDTKAFSTSMKESFDSELRRIIMTTPSLSSISKTKNSNGDYEYIPNYKVANAAGLPVPLNYNTVYPYLMNQMATAVTLEEMLSRLENMAYNEPSIFLILEQIKNDPILQAKWFSNFNKAFLVEEHHRINDESGIVVSDVSNKQYSISNSWSGNINMLVDLLRNEDNVELYTSVKDSIQANLKTLTDMLLDPNIVLNDDLVDLIVKVTKELNIPFSSEIVKNILTNPLFTGNQPLINSVDSIFLKPLTFISKSIFAAVDSKKLNRRVDFNQLGTLNNLAKIFSYYNFNGIESTYVNPMGNTVYSFTKHNFMTDFFTRIESYIDNMTINKKLAEQNLLSMLKEYAADPSMRFSNWLFDEDGNGLLNGNPKDLNSLTLNLNALKNFKFRKIGGLKNMISGEGAGYAAMTDEDYDLHNIITYVANLTDTSATYPIQIQSDSGNLFVVSSKRIPVEVNKKGEVLLGKGSKIFEAFANIFRQELVRMKVAYELLFEFEEYILPNGSKSTRLKFDNRGWLIPKQFSENFWNQLEKNYHYQEVDSNGLPIFIKNGKPTGKVFTFSNLVSDSVDLNKVLEADGVFKDGILRTDLFTVSTNESIEAAITTLIKSEIEAGKNELSKYENKFIPKKVDDKWNKTYRDVNNNNLLGSYDNFEHFVADYVLNTYIANVEMFNFFTGSMAEFKNPTDSNKRAKQTTSPKLVGSTIFRGETFKAAIINDVELVSNNLEAMATNLATNLRNSNPSLTADNFSFSNLQLKADKKDVKLTPLESAVYTVVENYFKGTSIADAQGYLTMTRYEKICKDYGRWNKTYEILFKKANAGEELTSSELKTLLQVLKPFYYHRRYNPLTKKMESRQIKTSLLPLIPSLIKGTQLEKINEAMTENNIEEMYFESASKVGTKRISYISDKNGLLRENFKDNLIGEKLYNTHWGLQLDVPEHGKDEVNKLGVQIVKIIFSNLSKESVYVIPGSDGSTYTGSELRDLFHNALSKNIEEDSETLLERIGAEKDAKGNIALKDISKIQEVLLEELKGNNMNKNYLDAVQLELDENNKLDFVLPLSVGNMTKKFQSLLTSLFTNKVINQKMPGGHYTLASEAYISLIDKVKTEEDINNLGITLTEKAKNNLREGKRLLDYHVYSSENKIITTALLPAWSTRFFKEGQRIDINELPEDVRTMIGYRIPTEGKYSTVVFEVVGFLPESAGSTVVVPYELVTQTGWDFDVDSLYVMQKELDTNYYDGTIYAPSMFNGDVSRKARNNIIIDIFRAVLQNDYHYKELISPGKFNDAANMKKRQEKLLGMDKVVINPYSYRGQKGFRKANMAGRKLKGMAANINSLLPILQNVKAYTSRPIKMSYEIKSYEEYKTAVDKHGDNVFINDEEFLEKYEKKVDTQSDLLSLNLDKTISEEDYVPYSNVAIINETEEAESKIPPILLIKTKDKFSVGDSVVLHNDTGTKYRVTTKNKLRKNFSITNMSESTYIGEDKLVEIKDSGEYYETITLEKVISTPKEIVTEKNFPKRIEIAHSNFGFNVDGTYTNLNGDVITDHAAQMLAMVLDIVKEGFPHNVNSYTFNTYMAMLGLGIDIMHAGIFIRQPIINALAELNQSQESIFTSDNTKPVEEIRNRYEMNLLQVLRKLNMPKALTYYKKHEKFITEFKKLPGEKELGDKSAKKEALGLEDLDKITSFTLKELEDMLAFSADKENFRNLSKKTNEELMNIVNFYVNQLAVLDKFLHDYKTGEHFGNLPQIINMDKMGVGPSLSVTEIWETRYQRVLENAEFSILSPVKPVGSENKGELKLPVVESIYEKDVYTIFKAYREFGNKTAVSALSPLFLELTPAFKAIRKVFYTQYKIPMNDVNDKLINNFLLAYINNSLFTFANDSKTTSRILGEKSSNLKQSYTIEEFRELSAAEQLYYMKSTYPEMYLDNPEHILNFVNPKIDSKSLERNQYQKIEVNKPSPSDDIDYEVSQTFLAMLYSENEFEKELAESLFKYNYLTSYLNFTKDSFSNLIPTAELISRGLGKHLREIKQTLEHHTSNIFVQNPLESLIYGMEANITEKINEGLDLPFNSEAALKNNKHLSYLEKLYKPLYYQFLQNHSNNSSLVPKISRSLFVTRLDGGSFTGNAEWEPIFIFKEDMYKLAPKNRNKNAYLMQSTDSNGDVKGTLYVKAGKTMTGYTEKKVPIFADVYIPMEKRGGKAIKYEFTDTIFESNRVAIPSSVYGNILSYMDIYDKSEEEITGDLISKIADLSSVDKFNRDNGSIDCK